MHVPDDHAEHIQSRGHILEYVMGAVMPKDLQILGGYANTWRKMMALTISKLQARDLSFLSSPVANKILEARPLILQQLASRKQNFLDVPGVGKASSDKLLPKLMEYSSLTVDGKVTIDTKRILRLPSSLHSKISMICTLIKNPETFDPLRTAVPAFVYERDNI